jgi:hypothetical protein
MSDSLLGRAAPTLILPTLDGDRFDLVSLEARVVLVTFLRHAG